MTTVSVSELKAKLSAFLDIVRHGEDVLVTDRGRPIARLTSVAHEDQEQSRRQELLGSGRLRGPLHPVSPDFFERRRPSDVDGASLRVLRDERATGR